MSKSSDKQKIFRWLYRSPFPAGILDFDTILNQAARIALGLPSMDADRFVVARGKTYWNWLRQEQDFITGRGLTPIFSIKDDNARRISWYPADIASLKSRKQKLQARLLQTRPYVLRKIDTLDDRKYEALACTICRMLNANKVVLTARGNEGGVDFFASIILPQRSHVLFGAAGPLRIIGQCKFYNDKVQVGEIRDFITTIADVKSYRLRHLVPTWFQTSRGPIIGWFIGHTGFQSGAEDRAKEEGIILSNSLDLSEIISLSRKFEVFELPQNRARALDDRIQQELFLYQSQVVN